MRAHQIKDGKIINTIVVDSLDILPDLIDADQGGKIGDIWDGETFTTPIKVPTREELKLARAAAVAAITVAVGGKTFDGDETSQDRMTRAIIGLQAAQVETITWTLADNTVAEVTVAELTQALILAGQRQAELWPITV